MNTTESGAAHAPVLGSQHARLGEDRYLNFRCVDQSGALITSFAGWTFAWAMRESRDDPDVIMAKVSPTDVGGATMDDWLNPGNPILVARVFISRASWAGMSPGRYFHSLARTDPGHWTVLGEGPFEVLHAATW